jgi:hypothetical protein
LGEPHHSFFFVYAVPDKMFDAPAPQHCPESGRKKKEREGGKRRGIGQTRPPPPPNRTEEEEGKPGH